MPDIDVDFDDDGRYRVIQYVQDRYGVDQVSHAITFGTMAAKLAIRMSRASVSCPWTNPTGSQDDTGSRVLDSGAVRASLEGGSGARCGQAGAHSGTGRTEICRGVEDKDYKVTLENCLKFVPEFGRI